MTKRCTQCGVTKPWSEFYAGKKWPDGTPRYMQPGCKACRKLTNAAKCAAYTAKLMRDPERLGIRRAQWRDYAREKLGITPDRYRVGVGVEVALVDAAPIRDAIIRSRRSFNEIARQAGVDEGTVRKAMARERTLASSAVAILRALDIAPAEVGL